MFYCTFLIDKLTGDMMHTGPLGVLQWFLGPTLYELLNEGPFGGTERDRLRQLWQAILMEYQAHNLFFCFYFV